MDAYDIGFLIGVNYTTNIDVIRGVMSKNHPIYTDEPVGLMTKEKREKFDEKVDAFYNSGIDDSYEKHPDWWDEWWGNEASK